LDRWYVIVPVIEQRCMIFLIFTDEILGAILPEDVVSGAPSGFAATGHIGELNDIILRACFMSSPQLIST
jgi:hypothetical protein